MTKVSSVYAGDSITQINKKINFYGHISKTFGGNASMCDCEFE